MGHPKRILTMAALALAGLLGPAVGPTAAATSVAGAVFVGTATTSSALSSPVRPDCPGDHVLIVVDSTSVSTVVPKMCAPPAHVGLSLSAHGLGASVSADPLATAWPLFSIHGHGSMGANHLTSVTTLGPHCGLFSGSLTAHWSVTGVGGPGRHGSTTAHWSVGVGSLLVVTGGGATVVAVAVPPTPTPTEPPTPIFQGGSCLVGTAANFTVVAAAVFTAM